MQVLFVEVGFGCDGHGQNVTVRRSKPPCMEVCLCKTLQNICLGNTAATRGPECMQPAESSHQSLQECH